MAMAGLDQELRKRLKQVEKGEEGWESWLVGIGMYCTKKHYQNLKSKPCFAPSLIILSLTSPVLMLGEDH